jgi:hypothetical protein
MSKKATAADAQLILELYDLRREGEMRKARHWWGATFQPTSADDLVKAMGSAEGAWFRQVAGYWDMAASLVLRGALNEELFFDCGVELWFILAKVHPYLKEYRNSTNAPEAFRHAETLATRTKEGRERLQRMIKRQEAARRKTMAETAKAS